MSDTIWVVSDIHLGGVNSNHGEFAAFINWLNSSEAFEVEGGGSKVVKRPNKLILLGDVLELWDPIDENFKNPLLQLSESLPGLFSFDGEIIFVTGNHDESLENYASVYPTQSPRLRIERRHYPDEDPRYVEIGGHRYFFLHGHQFDKLFRWAGFLVWVPALMASVNNTLSPHFPPRGWLPFIMFIIAMALYGLGFLPEWMTTTILPVLGVVSLPRIFTYLQTRVWQHLKRRLAKKPKYKNISHIVKEGYYDRGKDTIVADVVIYGHTHIAEISPPEVRARLGKAFVNTGSWVEDAQQNEKNTVVCIDENGLLLLKWGGKETGFRLLDSI